MNDSRKRLSAIEKCRKRLPVLRASGASDADLARLLVEPIVRWIGFDPTSFQSVRRDVRLVPFLPPVALLCLQNGEPSLAIILRPSLDDRTSQAYGAALAQYTGRSGGDLRVAFTDGDEWRAYRVDNGSGIHPLFRASLAEPERLLSLGPVIEPLQVPESPNGLPKPSAVDRASPQPSPAPPAKPAPPAVAPPSRPAPTPPSAPAAASGGPRPPTPPPAPAGVSRRPEGETVTGVRAPPSAAERPAATRQTAPVADRDKPQSYRYIREEETLTTPAYIEIDGKRKHVRRWVDVHVFAAGEHLRRRNTIPEMLFEKQRYPYASRQPEKLRRPRAVGAGWFVETNMNAHLACKVAAELLVRAGIPIENFDIRYYPR